MFSKADYYPLSQKRTLKIIGLVFLILCIGSLFVSKLWSGDNTDNLLGGCLISRGEMMYRDFFSHHAPLPYYVVGLVDTVTRGCTYLLPQLFFYAFFVASVVLLVKYTKSFFSAFFLLFTYASLGVEYSTTFVLAESWLATISILIFLLLFFHKAMSRLVFWALFVIVQFSILTAMPLFMLTACILFLYFSIRNKALTLYYFLGSFLPFFAFLLYLTVANYYHYVFYFNTTYYAAYTGSFFQQYVSFFPQTLSSIVHIFSTFVAWQHRDTYAFLFSIAVFVLWICLQIIYRKKLYKSDAVLFCVNVLVFLNLSFHTGGFHMVPLVFFALTEVLFFFSQLPTLRTRSIVVGILFVLLLRLFIAEVLLFYVRGNTDPSVPYYEKFILTHSKVSDKILIFPGKDELYLLTHRMPGSYYYFFLPWFADEKGAQQRVFDDIEKEKVKIIIIENAYTIDGHSPATYLSYVEKNLKNDRKYKDVSNITGVQIFLRDK